MSDGQYRAMAIGADMVDRASIVAKPARKAAPAPKSALQRKLPWNDKAGRFAPLKAVTLVLLPLPALYLLYASIFIGLGPRPDLEALHFIGRWTIWLLLITLAVTPARRLFDWSKLIQIRRIVGLTALYYILLHFTLYIVDSGLDPVFVAQEIVLRIYLTIGFTAILALIALGVTSTDGMIKRMGAVGWNHLHNLIYVIGFLGFVHYYMQAKLDVTEPVFYSGLFLWLIGYRIMAKLGYKEGLVPLLVLSLAAGLATALAEAGWYEAMHPGFGLRVLAANLNFAFDPAFFNLFTTARPAWWVLLAGLLVTAGSEITLRIRSVRSPRPARAVRA
jgi:sulfoxide reductase heme-binding subunit YedZ